MVGFSLKSVLTALLLYWVPVCLFAAGGSLDVFGNSVSSETSSQLTSVWQLAPPTTDASIMFLGQLFGSVGGVLGSASGQVMGQIFRAMNYGVILMAGSMLSYTTIMSVIESSQDGQFMGQGKKSAWVILRTVTGVSMMVPQATGYSFVQIFMMWAVVQGVGLADLAWGKVLDYLEHGGSVYTQVTDIAASDIDSPASGATAATKNVSVFVTASSMFRSSLCLAAIEKILNEKATVDNQTPYHWGAFVDANGLVRFGADNANGQYDNLQNICGTYQLQDYTQTIAHSQVGNTPDGQKQSVYMKPAAEMMYEAMIPGAQLVVSYGPDYGGLGQAETDMLQNAIATSLVGSIMNYYNITQPMMQMQNNAINKDVNVALKKSRSYGWIMAGTYYFTLSRINQHAVDIKNSLYPSQGSIGYVGSHVQQSDAESVLNTLLGPGGYQKVVSLSTLNQNTFFNPKTVTKAIQYAAGSGSQAGVASSVPGVNAHEFADVAAGMELGMFMAGGPVAAALLPILLVHVKSLEETWQNSFTKNGDPLLMIGNFGSEMVTTGVTIWIEVSLTMFLITMAASIMTSITGTGTGFLGTGDVVLPMVITVVTALIVNGVVLAIYVPMIPFLVFFFTALGWLMSVVEAMVAAPLVALGMTHPEGHDLLGKSEQSLMLLLSIFIKPIAMIAGFVASMLIVRLGVRFFNSGLAIVGTLAEAGNLSMRGTFQSLGLMIMYTVTVVAIVNFSFSLVHLLPDKIMRWIGVAPESYDVAGQLAEIKSGLSGGMSKLVQGATEASLVSPTWSAKMGAAAAGDKDKYDEASVGNDESGGPKNQDSGENGNNGESGQSSGGGPGGQNSKTSSSSTGSSGSGSGGGGGGGG